MNVPAKVDKAEALDFARQQISWFRDNTIDLFGMDLNFLDKEDSRRLAQHAMKSYALQSPLQMMRLVEYARAGWGLADAALRELIIEFLDRGEQLPTYLAFYSMDIARGGPRRMPARQSADNFLRDIAIVVTIGKLIETFGMKPTSRNGRNTCACSVVAEAMRSAGILMGYKAVAEVWRRYGRV